LEKRNHSTPLKSMPIPSLTPAFPLSPSNYGSSDSFKGAPQITSSCAMPPSTLATGESPPTSPITASTRISSTSSTPQSRPCVQRLRPWKFCKSPVATTSQPPMSRIASPDSKELARVATAVSPSCAMPLSNPLTATVMDEDIQSEWRVMSPAPGNGSGTAVGPG